MYLTQSANLSDCRNGQNRTTPRIHFESLNVSGWISCNAKIIESSNKCNICTKENVCVIEFINNYSMNYIGHQYQLLFKYIQPLVVRSMLINCNLIGTISSENSLIIATDEQQQIIKERDKKEETTSKPFI